VAIDLDATRVTRFDGGERRCRRPREVLSVAVALTAVFAPLTTRLYRKS